MKTESALNRARVPATVALQLVLDQHWELRQLLVVGLEYARANLSGEEVAPHRLFLLAQAACGRFVKHLEEEEALILPLLEDDLPLGPPRADRIREEHARQRAEIEALGAWRPSGDPQELAFRFSELASDLLADMEHEERELFNPDVGPGRRDRHRSMRRLTGKS
jgi:hypothetical protein